MKVPIICCFLLLFPIAVTGDEAGIATQITGLNTLLQSATERYDVDAISKLVAADYTLIDEKGNIWDRATFLKVVGDRSHTWFANDPSSVTVKSYNGDCAVLTGLLHIKFGQAGKVHDLVDRFTDVWVKDGTTWKYVQGQATLYKQS